MTRLGSEKERGPPTVVRTETTPWPTSDLDRLVKFTADLRDLVEISITPGLPKSSVIGCLQIVQQELVDDAFGPMVMQCCQCGKTYHGDPHEPDDDYCSKACEGLDNGDENG